MEANEDSKDKRPFLRGGQLYKPVYRNGSAFRSASLNRFKQEDVFGRLLWESGLDAKEMPDADKDISFGFFLLFLHCLAMTLPGEKKHAELFVGFGNMLIQPV